MTMRRQDIVVGATYRFRGYGGRELKPRTVISYDPTQRLLGGTVVAHTGLTNTGRQSQSEIMAGDYFIEHAEPVAADGERASPSEGGR